MPIPEIRDYRDFERIFGAMWAEENVERMEDLGVHSCVLKDEAEIIQAICVHYLNIPLREFRSLAARVPETNESSWERRMLEDKIESNPTHGIPVCALVSMGVVNAIIRKFNSSRP